MPVRTPAESPTRPGGPTSWESASLGGPAGRKNVGVQGFDSRMRYSEGPHFMRERDGGHY